MSARVYPPYSIGNATQAVALRNARITLSPALAHAGYRMRSVDVETQSPPLGSVTRDMLAPPGGCRVENRGVFVELGQRPGRLHAVGMDVSGDMLGSWRLRHEPCEGCERSSWREWGAKQPAGMDEARE